MSRSNNEYMKERIFSKLDLKASFLKIRILPWTTLGCLLLVSLVAFSARWTIEASHVGPSGSDYGNYLTNVAILWGNDVTGGGLQYPPLYLLLLTALMVGLVPLTSV